MADYITRGRIIGVGKDGKDIPNGTKVSASDVGGQEQFDHFKSIGTIILKPASEEEPPADLVEASVRNFQEQQKLIEGEATQPADTEGKKAGATAATKAESK